MSYKQLLDADKVDFSKTKFYEGVVEELVEFNQFFDTGLLVAFKKCLFSLIKTKEGSQPFYSTNNLIEDCQGISKHIKEDFVAKLEEVVRYTNQFDEFEDAKIRQAASRIYFIKEALKGN